MSLRFLNRLLLTASLSILGLQHVADGQTISQYAPDRILVRFKNDAHSSSIKNNSEPVTFNVRAIDALNATYGCIAATPLYHGRKRGAQMPVYALQFRNAVNIEEVVKAYTATGQFVYAEPDYVGHLAGKQAVIPNDPDFPMQWSLRNDGTFTKSPAKVGADIDMTDAWAIEQGDTSVIVAIIDTGCKLDHPEFDGRIWTNALEIPGNNKDDDHNGYIDDIRGWDFANNDNDPTDDHGHGTNVTGVIGANANNHIGYAGIDWRCKLMILKAITSQDVGYYSWWASAIFYAVDNGARVINMSLEGTAASQVLQDAVTHAVQNNVLVVACMGNENSASPDYPAACIGVMGVGSTNANDRRSSPFFWSTTSGSNFGSHISVCAPGNFIYSLSYQSNTDYSTYWGGTSQATPHVVGLASLLIAQDPTRMVAQLRSIIENTADDQVGDPTEDAPGFDQYYGHGRINARRALAVKSSVFAPDNAAPSTITIAPNPTDGRLTIDSRQTAAFSDVTITNVLGETVWNRSGGFVFPINVDLANVPKGIYFVRCAQGREVMTGKLLVR